MSVLDLRGADKLYFASTEAQQLYKGSTLLFQRQPILSDLYGVSGGTIPMDLDFRLSTTDSSGFLVNCPNIAGAGSLFDVIPFGTNKIPIVDGVADMNPLLGMRFQNTPNIIGVRMFLVVNIRSYTVNQYILGNGVPQSNIFVRNTGGRIDINRRSPITNEFENANINLSPSVTTGKQLLELHMSYAGTSEFSVNGEIRGTSTHPYPEYLVNYIGGGQNPGNGNGFDSLVYRVVSLVEGDDFENKTLFIRNYLRNKYEIY